MQSNKELERRIEIIKYDIETIEMEKMGLGKKLRFLKEKLVINILILIVILLFLKITIWSDSDNSYSMAFVIVLKPAYYLLTFVYIIALILKPMWNIYINSNLKSARKMAIKRGINSISVDIEMCDIKISTLNTKLRKYEETIEDENWDLC